VVGTQVVHKQMHYMTSMDIGYNEDHVVAVPLREIGSSHYPALKTELLRSDKILGVTGAVPGMPYFNWSTGTATWAGRNPEQDIHVYVNYVDYDFTETLEMRFISGRGFSREFSTDQGSGFVINEELANLMGPDTTVGTPLAMEDKTGEVIGIVKNFQFHPATNGIKPLALSMVEDHLPVRLMLVRLSPRDTADSLEYLADTWTKLLPEYPLEYSFLGERIAAAYWQTSQLSTLATSFSILAVFLAGLGMFGMASFTVSRRAKELAIRKVFGGSAPALGLLLWREYAACLAVACFIAAPLAYYSMHRWLQGFVFKVPIGIFTYLTAVILVTAITLLAVSWQTMAATRRRPSAVLR
jgi:hypothetical protein